MEKTEAKIKKVGNQWCVFSKDGTKNLGCSDTREGAVKRLGEVEHFKKSKGSQNMNYQDAFKNMAKAMDDEFTPEDAPEQTQARSLEDRLRRGTIAGVASARLLDGADHFPVLTVEQAQSSLARAFKLTDTPVWYSGSLDELREEVFVGAVTRHPQLADANVKVPVAVALSDGQTDPETSKNDIIDPADRRANDVKPVKRPDITSAATKLATASQDPETRQAMAGKLMEHLQKQKESLETAMKVGDRLTKKGLTADEFQGLMTFIQEDILRELLFMGVTASADERRLELLARLSKDNGDESN